jgi:hypothetical protein
MARQCAASEKKGGIGDDAKSSLAANDIIIVAKMLSSAYRIIGRVAFG